MAEDTDTRTGENKAVALHPLVGPCPVPDVESDIDPAKTDADGRAAFNASIRRNLSKCSKCRKPMPQPPPPRPGSSPIDRVKMTITGYRCECGHWNNLKSRKGWPNESRSETAP